MEQNPFYPSEGAQSGESKDKKSGGFNVAKPEQSPAPPQVERVVPAAPALERVISLWDRQSEQEHRRMTEQQSEDASGETKNDKDKDSKKDKDATKLAARQPAAQPIAEARYPHAEATSETDAAADESNAEQGETVQAEARDAVSRLDEGENPADDTHVSRQASTPRTYGSSPLPFPPVVPVRKTVATVRPQNEYAGTHRIEEEQEDPDGSVAQAAVTPSAVPLPSPNAFPGTAQTPEAGNHEQADDDDVPAPPQTAAAGGGFPPIPPSRQAAFAANQPPTNPNFGFANQYMHPGMNIGPQYNAAPDSPDAMPNAVPAMPIEHPLHTYNRDPGARQAAALLGVGLWAEHRGRKNADRRLEKADKQIGKLVEQQGEVAAINQRQMQERQRQIVDEQERQAAEMQRMRMSQERFAAPSVPPSEQFSQPRTFDSAPNAGPAFARRGPEAQPAFGPLEQSGNVERQAMPAPNAEQQAADQVEQTFQLSPNQHVEHSSWHNIVVDDRGHEVAGAIHYGEGFQRERQQEVIRDRMGDGFGPGQNAGSASGQYQQSQFGPTYPGALPSGMTNPALPQGKPTHADPQHQLEPHSSRPTSEFANPWLWIMIVLIAAAFFTAALV